MHRHLNGVASRDRNTCESRADRENVKTELAVPLPQSTYEAVQFR